MPLTDLTTPVFALPEPLHAKRDPALIAEDEQHFGAIAAALHERHADLTARLRTQRRAPGGSGQAALDRDLEIHRLTRQVRLLERFGLDLCLGRMIVAGQSAPVYLGRTGLTAADGTQLLVDWRGPGSRTLLRRHPC